MKRWLWSATTVGALLVAAAAVTQPIAAADPPCGPRCDPHGFVVIFSAVPALVVTLLALAAVTSLLARRRSGLWLAAVAAVCCAGEFVLLVRLLTVVHAAAIGVVLVGTVILATLGLQARPLDLKSS